MSAGLPGLGLGGLLFVICALLGPVVELARLLRGNSSAAAWRRTLRQFSLAVAMIGVFELVRRIATAIVGSGGLDPRTIIASVALLAGVLTVAKAAEVFALSRRRRRARAARRRARAGSGREAFRSVPAARLAPDPEG